MQRTDTLAPSDLTTLLELKISWRVFTHQPL